VNIDLTVLAWNPAAERTFGWSYGEAAGKRLPFIPTENFEEHRLLRDLSAQRFSRPPIRRLRKDGTMVELTVSTGVIRDESGNNAAIVAAYADFTPPFSNAG
jgi:PAS domain S-box-containing protein